MTGSLIQLITNSDSPQSYWLNENPQITFFKKVYRRHTPFTFETIPVHFKGNLNFGLASDAILPSKGDLVGKIFLSVDIPDLTAAFVNTKNKDLIRLIKTFNFTDKIFSSEVYALIQSENSLQFDKLMNLIIDRINQYDQDNLANLSIKSFLDSFQYGIKFSHSTKNKSNSIDSESLILPDILHRPGKDNFKINLIDNWINNFPSIVPIYELIKLIYYSEYYFLTNIEVLDQKNFIEKYVNEYIFDEIIDNHTVKLMNSIDTSLTNQTFNVVVDNYNNIINILSKLAKTVPILIAKSYKLNQPYDMYTSSAAVMTIPYPTIYDPSYLKMYLLSGKSTDFCIYYTNLVTTLFKNIRSQSDIIFNRYRNTLFKSTDNLFFNGSPKFSAIYSYTIPTGVNQSAQLISNVFNANIWFFYFFKYLDGLDQSTFANILNFSINGKQLVRYIIILVKVNIEYYMNEISYLLNDLYLRSPSDLPDITMKNYVPQSVSPNISGINVQNDLIAITFIHHRNHIPTISEIFEFIYKFINNISIDYINKILSVNLPQIDVGEYNKILSSIVLLYKKIYNYFSMIYDSYKFSPSLAEKLEENDPIDKFINSFINGFEKDNKNIMLDQMEFYFLSEQIGINCQKTFWDSVLDTDTAGKYLDSCTKTTLDKIKDWIQSVPDKYYVTDQIRFDGKPYIKTEYCSRFYGLIDKVPLISPLDFPPTDPYGVNPEYYNNITDISTDTKVNWINSFNNIVEINYSSNKKNLIDYYRLKHKIFYDSAIVDDLEKSLLFNLLKLRSSLEDDTVNPLPTIKLILEQVDPNYYVDNLSVADIIYEYSQIYLVRFENYDKVDYLGNIIKFIDKIIMNESIKFVPKKYDLKKYGLLNKILIDKNIFITKYFTYLNLIPKISAIKKIKLTENDSVLSILKKVAEAIENKKLVDSLNDVSPLVLFNSTNLNLITLIESINPIDRLLVDFFIRFDKPDKKPLLTKKDIVDNINNIFIAGKRVHSILKKNNSLDQVVAILEKYQSILLRKLQLVDSITENIYNDNLNTLTIAKIITEVNMDLVNKNTLSSYLTDLVQNIFAGSDKFVLMKSVSDKIDNMIFGEDIQIKDKIISDIELALTDFDTTEIINILNFIDNEYFSFVYFLFVYLSGHQTTDYNLVEYLYNDTEDLGKYILDLIDALWDSSSKNITNNSISNLVNENTNKSDYYLDEIIRKNTLIATVKNFNLELLNKIEAHTKNLKDFQESVTEIIVRNKKANCAWVRKLGHYLIEEVSIYNNDSLNDKHISDWLECYYQLTLPDSLEKSYLKMIGHTEDLITYNDSTKKACTLYIPLIFSFNKFPEFSLSLISSIYTKFRINVKLRDLSDLSYKDQFSDWVDTNLSIVTPSLQNVHLLVEYFYLSTEERKVFVSNILDYLVDELQYDINFVNESQLKPIYQIGSKTLSKHVLKNGVKTEKKYYDEKNFKYVTESELEKYGSAKNLIKYKYYELVPYFNRSGIQFNTLVKKYPLIDKYVHKKRFVHTNNFNNPSKIMVALFKPLVHVSESYRLDRDSYFYGEKQWDNYSLHSYYDLSKINLLKKNLYLGMVYKINDILDKDFGFESIIDQLSDSDPVLKPYLVKIKESCGTNNLTTEQDSNYLILKEALRKLNVNYPIFNNRYVYLILKTVHDNYNLDIADQEYYSKFQVSTKNDLIDLALDLLKHEIDSALFSEHDLIEQINAAYKKYNESVVEFIFQIITNVMSSYEKNLDFRQQIEIFYKWYTSLINKDPIVIQIINSIFNRLNMLSFSEYNEIVSTRVKNKEFKNMLLKIYSSNLKTIEDYYLDFINNDIIDQITEAIFDKFSELFENYILPEINIKKNLVPNKKINPLINGYLEFNGENIVPINSDSTMLSEVRSYYNTNRTPETGVNILSWSLNPFNSQHNGSANLSRIDNFTSVYDLHQSISQSNPVQLVTMVNSINLLRYLSGFCAKGW